MLGAFLGMIGFVRIMVDLPGETDLPAVAVAIAVGLTVLAVVIAGTIAGAMLPLMLRKVGIDPAIASSPFIASFVDLAGILIYLGVVALIIS